MAGRGPAPKPSSQRRRHGQPLRSEWVQLEPLVDPVLPPAKREWGDNAKRAWAAWRQDPVTAQWGPADVFFAMEICRLFDELPASELRLRCDNVGVTPKGKRDLRWRTPEEAETIAKQAPVRRLRLTEKRDDPA